MDAHKGAQVWSGAAMKAGFGTRLAGAGAIVQVDEHFELIFEADPQPVVEEHQPFFVPHTRLVQDDAVEDAMLQGALLTQNKRRINELIRTNIERMHAFLHENHTLVPRSHPSPHGMGKIF